MRNAMFTALLMLGGCGATPPVGSGDFLIREADVTGVWPLSKPGPATANCGDGQTTIFLEVDGTAYPLNQPARSRPDAYSGRLAVAPNENTLFKRNPELQQYGDLHYPLTDVLNVAIQRCRQAGLSTL